MLYYDLINEKNGVDYGKGKDMVRTSKNISKQCQYCNFYYFVTQTVRLFNQHIKKLRKLNKLIAKESDLFLKCYTTI